MPALNARPANESGATLRWPAMRRLAAAGVLALGFAAAVSGCGGSSDYSLANTKACFTSKGQTATELANKYLPGSAGNLRVFFGRNLGNIYVFMVFGKNHSEAQATENKAVNLAMASFKKKNLLMTRANVLAGIEVDRNVFYYSNTGAIPLNIQQAVNTCLS